MIREALDIIVKKDARSKKKGHNICYAYLREKHLQLHNKFAQEAYKRALAMYRGYRKLLGKWKRLPKGKRISPPSLPGVKRNRVVELHIQAGEDSWIPIAYDI